MLESVVKSKPASAKGGFVRSVTLAAAMCPGIHLEPSLYNAN
jgi:large subunit ribosomal protein L1